jgi:hypothetical protein
MSNREKNVEVAVETVAQPVVESVVESTEVANRESTVLSHEEAIAAFIAAGAELRESLHVERCAISIILDEDGNSRNTICTITVRESVRRMLLNEETGEFQEKEVHHFVVSLISLLKILGKNETFAPFTRKLQQQPKLLEMLMPGCKVSVLAINVEAGVEYTNFFTGNKSVPNNTSIYYEPTAVIAGAFASKQLEQAAQAVLMNALLA